MLDAVGHGHFEWSVSPPCDNDCNQGLFEAFKSKWTRRADQGLPGANVNQCTFETRD